MKSRYTTLAVALAIAAGMILGGCAGRSTGAGSFLPAPGLLRAAQSAAASSYTQIELLSRPAVKEAFELYGKHDVTNRAEPYDDPALQSQIVAFEAKFRSKQWADTLAAVLYPNEMLLDLSQNTTKGAYLGVESGGATGSKYGGRELSDDTIDLDAGAIWGNTLSALGVIPDDKKEVPCLATDNVAYDKSNTSTFPYVQAPL
jgi:hypothetical protein